MLTNQTAVLELQTMNLNSSLCCEYLDLIFCGTVLLLSLNGTLPYVLTIQAMFS